MIKITKLLNHGGDCPFQLDALTDDNRRIYGRYRGGWLKAYISSENDLTEDGAIDGFCIFMEQIGEQYDGYLTLEEFKEGTKSKFDWSEAVEDRN